MKDTIVKAVEGVLLRAFPNYTVENYTVSSGSSNGDNYVGVMYSVEAKLKSKLNEELLHKNLILKTSPENVFRKEFEENLQLFKKEASVYTQLIPELQKFQQNVIADSKSYIDLAFVPCYDVFLKSNAEENTFPWQYILMEDMRELEGGGYRMACRIEGLDYKHCDLVVSALAKYHALSYAYMKRSLQKSSDVFQRFPFLKESMFTVENESNIKDIYMSGTDAAKTFFTKHYAESSPEFQTLKMLVDGVYNINTHFVAGSNDLSMKKMAESPAELKDVNFAERERKAKNQWLVLSHGDCWVNNFLFQYTGNIPTAVKLVDLQIVREICLTTDLTYFLLMSTTGELRKKYLDQLLSNYYNTFIETCAKLGVEAWEDFTLENLKKKFRKNFCYGAATAGAFLALIILPKNSTMDMEKEAGKDGSFFGSVFSKAADLDNDNLKNRLVSIVEESMAIGMG